MGLLQAFREGFEATWTAGDDCPGMRDEERACVHPNQLRAELRQRESELDDARQLIAELAAEVERLSADLKARRRGEPSSAGEEKFRKLRRLVLKHVHPDRAASDIRLRAALEAIAKNLNAEIETLDHV